MLGEDIDEKFTKAYLNMVIRRCDDDTINIRFWNKFHAGRKAVLAGLSYFPVMFPIHVLGVLFSICPPDYDGALMFDTRFMREHEYNIYNDKEGDNEREMLDKHDTERSLNGIGFSLACASNSVLSYCKDKFTMKQLLAARVPCYTIAAMSIYQTYHNTYLLDRNERLRSKAKKLLNE